MAEGILVRRPRRVPGPPRSGHTSKARATRVSAWLFSAATRCSGRRASNRQSMDRYRLPHARQLQRDVRERNCVDPDTSQPWTGTWRDPRFPQADGNNPENALIGQLWMVNCCADRIHVPASMAGLRFWRNTAVADLAPGDTNGYRTSAESLGYEWDEVIDNGMLPSGLVRMSMTTLPVPERVVDFGDQHRAGTATHSLTLYRHRGGALVFGAGTVQWAWGLDEQSRPRRGRRPDQAMQQATVNLFADIGVQPATLQRRGPLRPLVAGAMSGDVLAPTTTSGLAGRRFVGRKRRRGHHQRHGDRKRRRQAWPAWRYRLTTARRGTPRGLLSSGVWNYEWTPGSPGSVAEPEFLARRRRRQRQHRKCRPAG